MVYTEAVGAVGLPLRGARGSRLPYMKSSATRGRWTGHSFVEDLPNGHPWRMRDMYRMGPAPSGRLRREVETWSVQTVNTSSWNRSCSPSYPYLATENCKSHGGEQIQRSTATISTYFHTTLDVPMDMVPEFIVLRETQPTHEKIIESSRYFPWFAPIPRAKIAHLKHVFDGIGVTT